MFPQKVKYVVGGVFSLLTSLVWVLFSSHDHAVLKLFWDLVCPSGLFGDDMSCYLPHQELHSWFGFVDWVNCGVIATSNFYLHNVFWDCISSDDHAVLRLFWDLVCPSGLFGDDMSCYLPYQELHSWFGFVDWVNCGVIATSNFYLHNVL
jgi:hypothetical protein